MGYSTQNTSTFQDKVIHTNNFSLWWSSKKDEGHQFMCPTLIRKTNPSAKPFMTLLKFRSLYNNTIILVETMTKVHMCILTSNLPTNPLNNH